METSGFVTSHYPESSQVPIVPEVNYVQEPSFFRPTLKAASSNYSLASALKMFLRVTLIEFIEKISPSQKWSKRTMALICWSGTFIIIVTDLKYFKAFSIQNSLAPYRFSWRK